MFLGVFTLIEIPGLAVLVGAEEPSALISFAFALIYWGLWVFYLWDIKKNANVPREKERRWRWAIFLGGAFVEPVYFWRFLWPDEPV